MATFDEHVYHIFFKKDLFVLFTYMCVCACMILCTSWEFICIMCLRVPTEARGHCPPGAGATGTCEPPNVGIGVSNPESL